MFNYHLFICIQIIVRYILQLRLKVHALEETAAQVLQGSSW